MTNGMDDLASGKRIISPSYSKAYNEKETSTSVSEIQYCTSEVKVQCKFCFLGSSVHPCARWAGLSDPAELPPLLFWKGRKCVDSFLQQLFPSVALSSVGQVEEEAMRDKDWIMHDCFMWAACAWLHVTQVDEDVQGHAAVLCLTCCCSDSMFAGELRGVWMAGWICIYAEISLQHS